MLKKLHSSKKKRSILLELIAVFCILFTIGWINMNFNGSNLSTAPKSASGNGNSDQMGFEWPMYRGGLSRRGSITTELTPMTAASNSKPFWNYTLAAQAGSPVVADGFVYVSALGVHKFDAMTGEHLWYWPGGITSTPAVAGDYLYVGSGQSVVCIDTDTGLTVWSYNTGQTVLCSPAVSGGYVYIGTNTMGYSPHLYMFNAIATGTNAPIHDVCIGDIMSSPAIVGGYVYVGASKNITCLSADDLTTVWSHNTGSNDELTSTPCVAVGYVYIGAQVKGLQIYSTGSGGTSAKNLSVGSMDWTSPSEWGSMVFVGSQTGNVSAFDLRTEHFGNSVWNFTTAPAPWEFGTNSILSSPAIVPTSINPLGANLYIGSDDGIIYCLNAVTGKEIWHYATVGPIGWSSPAIWNGRVYIGSSYMINGGASQGMLYCLPMNLTAASDTTTTPSLDLDNNIAAYPFWGLCIVGLYAVIILIKKHQKLYEL
jgi:outer membrane protein assembly factor BamB